MGFKFDEKTLINNNIFKYEDKLNSQYTRFLDQTPTYVTYYNINSTESTVDLGFSNVEKILGYNSPIKFNEIVNFPIYGMEAIQLSIDEDEAGLDMDYEGELIILPDTIKPYPNDFFIIEHKGKDFLFQVTSVEFDTIRSNNFYKIRFSIKYVTEEDSSKITKQVTGKYTCVVDNIGTEDKCIIENEILELLNKLQNTYTELMSKYIMYFYNKKYNTFIYVDINRNVVYDRYLNMFIQKHGLIYDGDTHKCIYLSNEDETPSYNLEYDRSLYKVYEMRKPKRMNMFKFRLKPISNIYSVFKYYNVNNCNSVRFTHGDMNYIEPTLTNAIRTGIIPENNQDGNGNELPIFHLQNSVPASENIDFDELDKIIVKYMNDQIENIYDIDFDELEDSLFFDLNWNSFIKIPMALYAIKGYYKLFVKKQ